ncbi:MAG: DUF4363 family protein [Clostridiales bacterium]|nr:DUF4363 family protein [Clostridiales bacterium]
MKNVAVAICITLITLLSMIAYNIFLNRYFMDIYTKCNNILNAVDMSPSSDQAEITDDIAKQINQIINMWNKRKNALYLVCNHQLIEEIDKAILSLELSINKNSKQDIYSDISILAFYLNKFMENEKFSIKNVF